MRPPRASPSRPPSRRRPTNGLATRRGLEAVHAWEREHGALTDEELAAADAALDRAGVGVRR